ncbi:MAG: hypothetical protein J5I94_10420, partial [Phaeodactylibacter sp.]|nr:hypothetical protein [Phaeodactylibacter sp.]
MSIGIYVTEQYSVSHVRKSCLYFKWLDKRQAIYFPSPQYLDFGRAAILSRKWDRLVSRLKSRKSEFGPEWALNAFFSAFRLP